MKILSISILMFLSPFLAFSQLWQDSIQYKGHDYYLKHSPMHRYFRENPTQAPPENPSILPNHFSKFTVTNGTLVLIDIKTIKPSDLEKHYTPAKYTEGKLFPEGDSFDVPLEKLEWISIKKNLSPSSAPLPLEWFSGVLILNDVKQDKYILLEINQGSISKTAEFNSTDEYEEFFDQQMIEFIKSDLGQLFISKGDWDEDSAKKSWLFRTIFEDFYPKIYK